MKRRLTLIIGVWLIFACSCFLPAEFSRGGFREEGMKTPGYLLLLVGSISWAELDYISWLANPCFLNASILLLIRYERTACLFSGCGVFLSLLYSWGEVQYVRTSNPIAIGFDNGKYELRSGYIVWVLSHVLLFLVCLYYAGLRWRRKSAVCELKSQQTTDDVHPTVGHFV